MEKKFISWKQCQQILFIIAVFKDKTFLAFTFLLPAFSAVPLFFVYYSQFYKCIVRLNIIIPSNFLLSNKTDRQTDTSIDDNYIHYLKKGVDFFYINDAIFQVIKYSVSS